MLGGGRVGGSPEPTASRYGASWPSGLSVIRAWSRDFQATGQLAPKGQLRLAWSCWQAVLENLTHPPQNQNQQPMMPISLGWTQGWPGGQELLSLEGLLLTRAARLLGLALSPAVRAKPVWRCSLSRQRCGPLSYMPLPRATLCW